MRQFNFRPRRGTDLGVPCDGGPLDRVLVRPQDIPEKLTGSGIKVIRLRDADYRWGEYRLIVRGERTFWQWTYDQGAVTK